MTENVSGRFNDEQRAALAVEEASVAVSAGAGCGKTAVLTERYLRCLDGPGALPLSAVVAVTFTDKAARELRDRVRMACRARSVESGDAEHWRGVMRGLASARIGTFHSFCREVLRRFPAEAGVEPGFAVLEETLAPSYRARALDACFREMLSRGDDGFIRSAVLYQMDGIRQILTDLMKEADVDAIREWADRDPRRIVDDWRDLFAERALPALRRELAKPAQSCLRILRDVTVSAPAMKARRERLIGLLPELDTDDWARRLDDVIEEARMSPTKPADWSDPAAKDLLKDCLGRLRDRCKFLRDQVNWDEQATLRAIEHGRRLAALAICARETYDEWKTARARLDFGDLQYLTRRLLRSNLEVRTKLQGEIRRLLVDEFQDTDPVQAEIVECLAGDELASGKLFLVGDFKQSIYRFRGAQPDLFKRMRTAFPEKGRLSLSRNYRSVPGILRFVNALFAGHFGDEEHALQPAREAGEGRASVEFVWDLNDGGARLAGERRTAEAKRLARLIAGRLREGWFVNDRPGGGTRLAGAGDVVFLFRTLNDAAAYEQALADEGLDYHVVGGAAFYAQQEVLDVINLLALVEDPHDATTLAATLRGPFGCVSDAGLYRLATSPVGDLVAGFAACERLSDLAQSDRTRALRLRKLLGDLRELKDRRTIAELVNRALSDSGFEAALVADFLGERKRANVRKLVRLARTFDAEPGMCLADFTARLKADWRNPPREEEASTTDEDGDAIRLMTIHQAKGKEFPIVVLPDLGRKSDHREAKAVFRTKLGIIVKPPEDETADGDEEASGQSLGRIIDRFVEAEEDEAEAVRLFYVALTRAEEHLILSAAGPVSAEPESAALRLLNERFDLRTGELKRRPDEPTSADPGVGVINPAELIAGSDVRHPRRFRPLYLVTANAIERAGLRPTEFQPATQQPRASFELDSDFGLSNDERTIRRLVRAVLSEGLPGDLLQIEAEVARVAKSGGRWAPRALIAEAATRLTRWAAGTVGREAVQAVRCVGPTEWLLAWPPQSERPTVFRGRYDLRYRAGSDDAIVVFTRPGCAVAIERLRLLLSIRAVEAEGAGPIRRGILCSLTDSEYSETIRRFDDQAIAAAVRAFEQVEEAARA